MNTTLCFAIKVELEDVRVLAQKATTGSNYNLTSKSLEIMLVFRVNGDLVLIRMKVLMIES
jgi:hypothetical protein